MQHLLVALTLLLVASAFPTNKQRDEVQQPSREHPRYTHYAHGQGQEQQQQQPRHRTNRHRRDEAHEADEGEGKTKGEGEGEGEGEGGEKGVALRALLSEASRYMDPPELEAYDLSDPDAVVALRTTVEDLQAKNAAFNFGYSVQDGINDSFMERIEERDGPNVRGTFTYSDGFVERTVSYEADENGYRVTKMEIESIGDGPKRNELGKAMVQQFVSGVETQYAIQAEPLEDDEGEDEGDDAGSAGADGEDTVGDDVEESAEAAEDDTVGDGEEDLIGADEEESIKADEEESSEADTRLLDIRASESSFVE